MSFHQRVSERLRGVSVMGRASTIVVLAALVASGGCLPAFGATVVVGQDGGPVIAAGAVRIYPSFVVALEHNSNLLYANKNAIPTLVRLVSPGISLELPFSHSLFRMGYNLSTSNYGLATSKWIDTHTGLFDLDLAFGNGTAVGVHDDFHSGILETQIGDPGGEIPFQGQRYQANTAQVSVGHQRAGNHQFGFRLTSLSTTYLEPIVAPYFNEDAWSMAAVGFWRVRPLNWIQWEAQTGTAQLNRPISSLDLDENRTEHELSLLVGAGWQLSNDTILQFRVGPKVASYDAALPSTFRGLVGSLVAQNSNVVGTQWAISLARDSFASIFGLNNYFVSELLTLQAEMPRGTTLRFGGSTAVYLNVYPTATPQRRDRTGGVETWMGIRQNLWVEWRVFVRYDQRSSTIQGADYSAFRYGVGVVIGR